MKNLKIAALLALPIALGIYLNSAMSWRPRTLAAFREPVLSVSWSPDGKQLASEGGDGNVSVWDVGSMRLERSFSLGASRIRDVAFSSDGRWVAASVRVPERQVGGEGRLLDVRSGTLKRTWGQGVGAVVFLAGNKILASDESSKFSDEGPRVRLRDTESGRDCGSFYESDNFHIQQLISSPAGHTIVGLAEHGEVYWWNSRKSTSPSYTGEGVNVRGEHAAFSLDGKTLAVVAPVRIFSTGAISPNWRVDLYDVASHERRRILTGTRPWISTVALSHDGSTLAGSADKDIKLWDVASLKPLRTLQGHTKFINSLAFAPDGSTLASASKDGTLRLWRLR